MAQYESSVVEQQPTERETLVGSMAPSLPALPPGMPSAAPATPAVERAVRGELRRQIARLEREVSEILADRFPFLRAPKSPEASSAVTAGPRLPDVGELERSRDRLAAQVQDLRALVRRRTEHERRARELLNRMALEPGRYRYVRLPVSDLGEGGCGVWEVRPRLGLIGMLAGWWQLKLSSGCPLEKGSRAARDPGPRSGVRRASCCL